LIQKDGSIRSIGSMSTDTDANEVGRRRGQVSEDRFLGAVLGHFKRVQCLGHADGEGGEIWAKR
jgi:hypothetical protein